MDGGRGRRRGGRGAAAEPPGGRGEAAGPRDGGGRGGGGRGGDAPPSRGRARRAPAPASAPVHTPAGAAPQWRVLCLHGATQTGEVFRARLAPLVRRLEAAGATLHFSDGPFELARGAGASESRTWIGEPLSAAVAAIDAAFAAHGPFRHVVGFSAGASLAAAIAVSGRYAGVEAAIVASPPRFPGLAAWAKVLPQNDSAVCRVLLATGAADRAVPKCDSLDLLAGIDGVEAYDHDKGHCMPCRASDVRWYVSFLCEDGATGGAAAGGGAEARPPREARGGGRAGLPQPPAVLPATGPAPPPTPPPAAPSAEALAARTEEFEALEAIFGDEFAPLSNGDGAPVGCVVRLDKSDANAHFSGPISLVATFPAAYPAPGVQPDFRIDSGDMSAAEFPGRASAALRRAADSAIADAVATGEACMFFAVAAANELLDARDIAREDAPENDAPENDAPHGDRAAPPAQDDDDDDAAAPDFISELTSISSRDIAAHRSFARDAVSHAGALPSARSRPGAWELVVGIVGKPSVGKSTFFNAVTRATGVLAAKVAAYPFTTIDPNIREGAFAAWDTPELRLGLPRQDWAEVGLGRDARDRRLLPVLLKDVAGLVPGAYQGLGKGNRFLNDLLDADALVHVVDASAETDDSGEVLAAEDGADGDAGAVARVVREVCWVREEMHRWIAGNVAKKWSSVTRRAKHSPDLALDRLLELFNGYHATPNFTRKALALARLETAGIGSWRRDELHKLVACFLEVRFPTVVALNKCDRPRARSICDKLLLMAADPADALAGIDFVPCSAALEAGLVRARHEGRVAYVDGAPSFDVVGDVDAFYAECSTYLQRFETTGTLNVISRAVERARPTLAFPIGDLETLCGAANSSLLGDCLVLRADATVEDLFLALISRKVVAGDFVRADAALAGEGDRAAKQLRRPLKRTDALDAHSRVVKVFTNRRAKWQ